jgi:hypothetical protein
VESLSDSKCEWYRPDRPICELPEEVSPISDAGVGQAVALCRPLYRTMFPAYECFEEQ